MHRRVALSLLAILAIIVLPARADWDDTLPFKWVQHPDLGQTGIDVMASYGQNLADDFECTVTGALTDIHIWGSWYHDVLPEQGDPAAVNFRLTIYKDIPADQTPNGYSQPGEVLWQKDFPAGSFAVRPEATDIEEGWMEYPDLYEFPGDTVCWQYNFFIDAADAFVQQGVPGEPVVYWLGVVASPVDGAARFGWKTSLEHWNDDAVWAINPDPPSGPWQELRYPPQHPLSPESIDLAFVINGEGEPQQELDFGDAPDPTYPTLAANFGASHGVTPNLYLGASIDPEPDGQPNASATGDDINLLYPGVPDDEDGVVFTSPLIVGQMATVDVVSTGGGLLNAWIDFLGNGNWTDPVDHVFVDLPLVSGLNSLSFMVPAGIGPVAPTFARFRLSYQSGIGPGGAVPWGEVEDYRVEILEPQQDLDFGDAPGAAYRTILANNGARHVITPNLTLGLTIDAEPDGQPDPGALGDDNNVLYPGVPDDEDGVVFLTPLIQGQPATVQVTSSAPARLQAWFDWDINGDWNAANEQVFTDQAVVVGANVLNFMVPAGAVPGATSFARFRLSTQPGIASNGIAPDGEVEDYAVIFDVPPDLDFGDAPGAGYRTILANNGARHVITPNLTLGLTIDPEPDGQPDPTALGDDNNVLYPGVPDDEDGVVFMTPLVAGQPATVQVTSSAQAWLQLWVDWNANGSWADPGEQALMDQPVAPGPNLLNFLVPAGAVPGVTSFARFRLSTQTGIPLFGIAPDGEVEDYEVRFEEPQSFKWQQLPDLETTGIDVNASREYVLADDFPCTTTGPITEIHIFGSWLHDYLPFNQDPLAVDFTLSIHADIPAGTDGVPWSHPGELLWEYGVPAGSFIAQPYATEIREGWMDPPENWIPDGDTVCWEYTFRIPEDVAFWQLGDPSDEQIYWLDLKANPVDPDAWFGWKTSREHWNDDAVWGQGPEPFLGPWNELRYPPQHPFAGDSIDLAFSISGPEIPVEMDFGDAPDPTYPTLLASGGARHVIVPGIQLGQLIDAEGDGQPTVPANGDDTNGVDDEDGVKFLSPLGVGQVTFADVFTPGPGFLNLWIDFGGDGSWNDPGDHVLVDFFLPGALVNVAIPTPASAVPGPTYARFRFSRQAGLGPTGPAINGEVEDYAVRIYTPTGNEPATPKRVQLNQNVPNPFNPRTTISYELPREMGVKLLIYDLRGEVVKVLVNERVDQGVHETPWDGRDDQGRPVASGIYVVQLQAEEATQSMKITLVR